MMRIVLSDKCDILCGKLGGILFPDRYVITDLDALMEKVRTLPLTNRNARAFTKFVFENIEELEYHEKEIHIPPTRQEFFNKIDLKVAKVERPFEQMKLIYFFDKHNTKLQKRLEQQQEAEILTYQVLEARICDNE